MQLSKIQILSVLFAIFISLNTLPAFADKGGHGNGNGNDKHNKHDDEDADDDNQRYDRDNNVNINVTIGSPDRTVIRQYIAEDYHHHCPPGLAKKHNGCLPPGQAKKHYRVGHELPETVVYEPIPQPVLVQLHPIPAGYQYVRVDGDVLLIAEASHKVIDAITLLSAVGNQ